MENKEQPNITWKKAGKILLKLLLLALSVFPIGILELYMLMLLPIAGFSPVIIVIAMLMPPVLVIGLLFFKDRLKFWEGWVISLVLLLLCGCVNQVWNAYDESLIINTNPNIDLDLYLPFHEDSHIAVLENESNL